MSETKKNVTESSVKTLEIEAIGLGVKLAINSKSTHSEKQQFARRFLDEAKERSDGFLSNRESKTVFMK